MKNAYQMMGDTTIVYCNCRGKVVEVLVSARDLEKVMSFPNTWSIMVNKNGSMYVYGKLQGETIMLHRFIMETPKHLIVDHINRNGLDNRRENMRNTNHIVNARNRGLIETNKTGYTGVYFDKFRNTYVANIAVEGRNITLGRFKTMGEAINARAKGEVLYWGSER